MDDPEGTSHAFNARLEYGRQYSCSFIDDNTQDIFKSL